MLLERKENLSFKVFVEVDSHIFPLKNCTKNLNTFVQQNNIRWNFSFRYSRNINIKLLRFLKVNMRNKMASF